MRTILHWVAGEPFEGASKATAPDYDPATGEINANVLQVDTGQVAVAVSTAALACQSWAQSSLAARTDALFDFRDMLPNQKAELGEIISPSTARSSPALRERCSGAWKWSYSLAAFCR